MNNIDISKDALIDANALRNSNIQKRHIKENVMEIIRNINEEVKNAHREGKHAIITKIPIVFDIPNMTNADAQRAIWANIIENLKQKNYRVWINYTEHICKLKITWISSDDELALKKQNELLNMHRESF